MIIGVILCNFQVIAFFIDVPSFDLNVIMSDHDLLMPALKFKDFRKLLPPLL